VVKRAKGEDGKAMGTAHSNTMLDTRWYEVKIEVCLMSMHTANQIHRLILKDVVR